MKASDAGPLFAGARVAEAVPLAPLTTLRVGPVARRLITCTSSEQVVAVLTELDSANRSGDGGNDDERSNDQRDDRGRGPGPPAA